VVAESAVSLELAQMEANVPCEAQILADLAEFVRHLQLKNGIPVVVRAIRRSDEPLLVRLHEQLSERSVHSRYFSTTSLSCRIAQLARICRMSDREFALVALLSNEKTHEQEIIAVGQIVRLNDPNQVEWGLIIRDDYQKQGLGTGMFQSMAEMSRIAGANRMDSLISWENEAMRHISRRFGCNFEYIVGEHALRATLAL
jgi:acetyltransferase